MQTKSEPRSTCGLNSIKTMNIFFEEHQKLLSILLRHQVRFMLIGGYAVIYYGYGRTTGDMDIWLEPGNTNLERLLSAFGEFGISTEDLELLRKQGLNGKHAFHIGTKPKRIDFVTHINGVDFEDAIQQVNHPPVEDMQVPIIHYNHLIINKMITGRAKDKGDIEELQRIHKYKKE